jgi:osmoprotectant transport system permease protein
VTLAQSDQPLILWSWIGDHLDEVASLALEHVELTLLSVGFGLLISFPLAIIAYRHHRFQAPIASIASLLYTIPSLALISLLVTVTGFSYTTVVIPLTTYTLLILVRNVVEGLDGVPGDIKDAADGMGYSRTRRLLRIELPLAVPAIMAGVRIATVTVIGLAAVAGLLAIPSLGNLIYIGQNRPIRTAITVGIVLSVALAVTADLILSLIQRLLTPWARVRAER